jgi:hypothetical protein
LGKSVSVALHNLTLPGPGGENREGGCVTSPWLNHAQQAGASRVWLDPPVHAAVGLKHEGLQDPLVLNGLAGQHRLDQVLGRDLVELQVLGEALHAGAELQLGLHLVAGVLEADPVLGPLEHGLELVELGDLQVAGHDHLDHGLG